MTEENSNIAKPMLADGWVNVTDLLPNDGEFVLCFGDNQDDDEFLNDILDLYNDKKLAKSQLVNWLNPVLSVQFRLIDGVSCWLYPNILDGGLVDFSDSITHWRHLPSPPASR